LSRSGYAAQKHSLEKVHAAEVPTQSCLASYH
jgi:hypothetical protein